MLKLKLSHHIIIIILNKYYPNTIQSNVFIELRHCELSYLRVCRPQLNHIVQ